MQYSNILLATLFAVPLSYAQQAPDGVLVPFTSGLPACASQCGPLYDVQGGCSPPASASADLNCFCADSRLTPLAGDGTSGVSSVCGATACTSPTDAQAMKSWYTQFCANRQASPSKDRASGTASPKSGNSGNSGSSGGNADEVDNRTWIQSHYQWLIMAVLLVIGIPAIWVAAWQLRKRHLRKRERELEMRPPVTWRPNQTQGPYRDGVSDGRGNAAAGPSGAGGHYKESNPTIGDSGKLKKQKMGWFKPKP